MYFSLPPFIQLIDIIFGEVTMETYKPIDFLGDYIEGHFIQPLKSDGEVSIHSPGNLDEHVGTISYTYAHIDQACDLSLIHI